MVIFQFSSGALAKPANFRPKVGEKLTIHCVGSNLKMQVQVDQNNITWVCEEKKFLFGESE